MSRYNGFDLWVPGKPVPKGRPRMTRRGRVFTPATTVEYEMLIAEYAARNKMPTLEGPIEIAMDLHPDGLLVQAWEVECASSGLRGDVDNYVKIVMDGLQRGKDGAQGEGPIPNDRNVVRVTADKSP